LKYLKYLNYVLRHKYFVFIECAMFGMFWHGLLHDMSKFRPSEFIPYANHFYGGGRDIKSGRDKSGYYRAGDSGEDSFDLAWLLHQKRNKHHWQWWVLLMDDGTTKIFEIEEKYVWEMICDWRGAGKAQNSKLTTKEWYGINKYKMTLHDNTRLFIEEMIGYKR